MKGDLELMLVLQIFAPEIKTKQGAFSFLLFFLEASHHSYSSIFLTTYPG